MCPNDHVRVPPQNAFTHNCYSLDRDKCKHFLTRLNEASIKVRHAFDTVEDTSFYQPKYPEFACLADYSEELEGLCHYTIDAMRFLRRRIAMNWRHEKKLSKGKMNSDDEMGVDPCVQSEISESDEEPKRQDKST